MPTSSLRPWPQRCLWQWSRCHGTGYLLVPEALCGHTEFSYIPRATSFPMSFIQTNFQCRNLYGKLSRLTDEAVQGLLPTANEVVYYSCFVSEFSASTLSGQWRGHPGGWGRLIQVLRLMALAELFRLRVLEFSNMTVKLFFSVDCPGLSMKSCGHCEDLFNYCYVNLKELLHLLILTDGVSTVQFNTRRLSHWCEMITLHGEVLIYLPFFTALN